MSVGDKPIGDHPRPQGTLLHCLHYGSYWAAHNVMRDDPNTIHIVGVRRTTEGSLSLFYGIALICAAVNDGWQPRWVCSLPHHRDLGRKILSATFLRLGLCCC